MRSAEEKHRERFLDKRGVREGAEKGGVTEKVTDNPAFFQTVRGKEIPERSTASGALSSTEEGGVSEEECGGGFFCLFSPIQSNSNPSVFRFETSSRSHARHQQPTQATSPLPVPRSEKRGQVCLIPI